MALPCVTVTSLILPLPQVPSSTRTVAPFLMSSGSCLTTTCAAHIPLAASTAANATDPVISVLMAPLVPRNCPVLKRDTAMVFHNLQSLTAAPARTLNVTFGSKASISACLQHVRFAGGLGKRVPVRNLFALRNKPRFCMMALP
jgi:hypothetical protein